MKPIGEILTLLYFLSHAGTAALLYHRWAQKVHFINLYFLSLLGSFVVIFIGALLGLPVDLFFLATTTAGIIAGVAARKAIGPYAAAYGTKKIAVIMVLIAFSALFVSRKGLVLWDDYSNWAFLAKVIYAHNGLPDSAAGLYKIDYAMFQSFIWGAASRFFPEFNEKIGSVIVWMIFAIGTLRFISSLWLYIVTLFILPLLFPAEYFGMAYMDGAIAVGFALFVHELLEYRNGRVHLMAIIAPLLLLLFAKPAGIVLLLIAIGSVTATGLLFPAEGGLSLRHPRNL